MKCFKFLNKQINSKSIKNQFFNKLENSITTINYNNFATIINFKPKTSIISYNSTNNKTHSLFVVSKKFLFGKKEKKHEETKKENNEDEHKAEDTETHEKSTEETTKTKDNKEAKENSKEEVISMVKYNQLNTLFKESEENLNKARTKFDELRKAYLDSQSDMERIRKRSEIDVANAKDFAITKFAKDMLDVYDNFERALESIKNSTNETEGDEVEKLKAKLKSHEDFIEGIEMTKASLNRILNFHGVKEYKPLKERFDPNKHEAVCQVPSEDLPSGTVASVMQSGFMIGTRVLRPAKVAVVKK